MRHKSRIFRHMAVVFIGPCILKYVVLQFGPRWPDLDPLEDWTITAANWFQWTVSGHRNFEFAVLPLRYELAWLSVYLGVYGFECACAAGLLEGVWVSLGGRSWRRTTS